MGSVGNLGSTPPLAVLGLASVFFYVLPALVFLVPVSLVAAELASGWPRGVYNWVSQGISAPMGLLAAGRDLAVGGARLAAQAIAAGLVDEYQLFVVPAVVGGGTRPAGPGPPEPGPGRGAQVRRRHCLSLLPPGLGQGRRQPAACSDSRRRSRRS